ncbi:myo-inositol-1(or 4)-monophosphatase [Cyclobacterium xiamenense]|uniref:Inositol-1-monophosphatase n=1 Tax=Cyclobacterium xiamenense TaxID=1297121 RepID=A0A1H6Y5K1_9BACT|nr:inositol monophosphatase family protein [Cyclobacterium xiamenense]SEJ32462.1 myo-inositol-1(or 4)-monophosphatase [Cyclobacterium xiamenense]
MDKLELERVTREVAVLARHAGAFIREEGKSFNREKVEQKGFNDLVSYVDKGAEKIIVEGLAELLPQAGFITEEGTRSDDKQELTWIVDPLDGTTNFVHGIPTYAVSIALARGNEVLSGVVYEINLDECFAASLGSEATCNDQPIRVSTAADLGNSLVATGFPYDAGGKTDQYLDLLAHFLKNTHGLRRLGSAAVDLCYVACGRVEGYLEYNLQSYDVAAGTLIVKQAGGQVTDFRGGENYLFGGQILASNGKVHQDLLDAITTYFEL